MTYSKIITALHTEFLVEFKNIPNSPATMHPPFRSIYSFYQPSTKSPLSFVYGCFVICSCCLLPCLHPCKSVTCSPINFLHDILHCMLHCCMVFSIFGQIEDDLIYGKSKTTSSYKYFKSSFS